MKQTRLFKAASLAAVTAAIVAVPSAVAAGSPPKVSVRIEGLHRTLMDSRAVQTKTGKVRRDGHSFGRETALGALNTATKGRWSGTWSSEYKEWELIGISGEQHSFSSKDFWAVYVNHVQASKGVSEIKLKSGENVVFAALPDAHYDEQLIGVQLKHSGKLGSTLHGRVVAYNDKGKAVALKSAKITAGLPVSKSGSSFSIKLKHTGKYTIKVSKSGYVRAESTITVKKA